MACCSASSSRVWVVTFRAVRFKPVARPFSAFASGFDSDLDTVSAALDEQILRTDVAKTLPRAELATTGAETK